MSQASGTQPSGKSGGKKALWLGAIALVVVAVGAGLFSYVGMAPHTVTSVSTSYATNTSILTSTQTVTSLSTNTFTSVVTTTAAASVGNPYAQQYCLPNCQQPCYYNNCQMANCYLYNQCDFFNACQTQSNNTVQCSGYLYQDPSGCVELVIAIWTPYAQPSYQYYTLQDLPASHPQFGSWVTVTGQSYRGSNTASNGAACPGNYIVVSSIS